MTANQAPAEAHEAAAWLITGGRLYKDQVVLLEASADDRIETRADGSTKVPLFKAQPKGTADELRAAAKQALETLELYVETYNSHWERGMEILEPDGDAALARLRAALAATKEGS